MRFSPLCMNTGDGQRTSPKNIVHKDQADQDGLCKSVRTGTLVNVCVPRGCQIRPSNSGITFTVVSPRLTVCYEAREA